MTNQTMMRLVAACAVIGNDVKIRAYLEANDPMALKQVDAALAACNGDPLADMVVVMAPEARRLQQQRIRP